MRKSLITIPFLVGSSALALANLISTRRSRRRQLNENFILRYGICPAGKWKMPAVGQQVLVPGVFKPRFDGNPLTIAEVIVCRTKEARLRLRDAKTGMELPILGHHEVSFALGDYQTPQASS